MACRTWSLVNETGFFVLWIVAEFTSVIYTISVLHNSVPSPLVHDLNTQWYEYANLPMTHDGEPLSPFDYWNATWKCEPGQNCTVITTVGLKRALTDHMNGLGLSVAQPPIATRPDLIHIVVVLQGLWLLLYVVRACRGCCSSLEGCVWVHLILAALLIVFSIAVLARMLSETRQLATVDPSIHTDLDAQLAQLICQVVPPTHVTSVSTCILHTGLRGYGIRERGIDLLQAGAVDEEPQRFLLACFYSYTLVCGCFLMIVDALAYGISIAALSEYESNHPRRRTDAASQLSVEMQRLVP